MKTDDDCFVDVPKVLALLREKKIKKICTWDGVIHQNHNEIQRNAGT